jgi:hypothetical protein
MQPPVAAASERIVRAACPHDCPDTCAMLVTVREEGGRRVAGVHRRASDREEDTGRPGSTRRGGRP